MLKGSTKKILKIFSWIFIVWLFLIFIVWHNTIYIPDRKNIQSSIFFSYSITTDTQDPEENTIPHLEGTADPIGLARRHLARDQTQDAILNIPSPSRKDLESNNIEENEFLGKNVSEINKYKRKNFDSLLGEYYNEALNSKLNYPQNILEKILIQNHSIWNSLKILHLKIGGDLKSLEFTNNHNNINSQQQVQLERTVHFNDSFLNEGINCNLTANLVSGNNVMIRTREGKFDKCGLPQRYKSKNQKIRSICASKHEINITSPKNVYDDINMRLIIVHEKLKVIWCKIPKCGSTFWSKILMGINEGIYNMSSVKILPIHFTKDSKSLNYYKQKNAMDIIDKYPKFLFTRHPFERLHSAYIDKILGSNNHVVNEIHEEIKNMMTMKRSRSNGEKSGKINSSVENLKPNNNYGKFRVLSDVSYEDSWVRPLWSSNIKNEGGEFVEREKTQEKKGAKENEEDDGPLTFSQFLSYIVEHDKYFPGKSMNVHWQPSYNVCQPCHIPYDFVGKLEDMSLDGQVLFDLLGFSKFMAFPGDLRPNHSFRKIGDTKSIFRALDPELYKKLRRVYDQDFEMFNYSDVGYDPSN
ncbi:unnamed protein product [Gordionus sp. m RMFG-2023]